MKSTRVILRTIAPLLVLWLVASPALAAPVFGTVLKAESTEPLVKAEVEILRPGTQKVQYRAYTDGKGKFALRHVDPGDYEVRVKFGRSVLEQIAEGKPVRRQRFRMGEEATRFPTLRVR